MTPLRPWFLALFGAVLLFGCAAPEPPAGGSPVQDAAVAEAEPADTDNADAGIPTPDIAAGPVQPRRGGLLGLFARNAPEPDSAAPQDQDEQNPEPAPVPDTEEPTEPPRRGLFGLFGAVRAADPESAISGAASATPATSVPLRDVTAVLPFGQVATVCGVAARDLGDPVAQSPRDGRAQWQLYDSAPSSTGPRTQYVTGFRDRCARQITGAMVLFGSADVHETTRYARTNTQPYTSTDDAYETVKSRLCGVRQGVPCPSDRTGRLEKAVSFVTVYPAFGSTGEWYELLLVDGRLEAAAMSGL
ncbi:MAG: hypothetical protein GW905_02245 [Rhodobacterales bacterium]|nr:hypothetical protein [Rhodobacterales bacterium]